VVVAGTSEARPVELVVSTAGPPEVEDGDGSGHVMGPPPPAPPPHPPTRAAAAAVEPSAERGLPRPAQRYYGERFARLGDRLRSAKQILILGRSSRDRSSSISRVIANNNLAQNRMQHVAQWIVELAATPRDRDAMAKKLIRLSLGDRQPLTREQLARNPMHQYIAWKKGREDLLVSQVRGAEALDESQREQVSRTLNQSVLVIPVPCEIPE